MGKSAHGIFSILVYWVLYLIIHYVVYKFNVNLNEKKLSDFCTAFHLVKLFYFISLN